MWPSQEKVWGPLIGNIKPSDGSRRKRNVLNAARHFLGNVTDCEKLFFREYITPKNMEVEKERV